MRPSLTCSDLRKHRLVKQKPKIVVGVEELEVVVMLAVKTT